MLRRVPTLSELPLVFESYLQKVMKGEPMPTDSGLGWETVKALKAIAAQRGNPSVTAIAAAKATFNRDLEIGQSR